jgi:hypothetical protein
MSSTERAFGPRLLLVLLALGISIVGQTRTPEAAATPANGSNPFIGSWRLVSLEEADANGRVHKAECSGIFIFSADGKASVQVMYRSPKTDNNDYAEGGYEASFGSYEINDAHTFTLHVEGALVRTLVGKDLKREYVFTGNQLIVKSSDPNERWRVTWERN